MTSAFAQLEYKARALVWLSIIRSSRTILSGSIGQTFVSHLSALKPKRLPLQFTIVHITVVYICVPTTDWNMSLVSGTGLNIMDESFHKRVLRRSAIVLSRVVWSWRFFENETKRNIRQHWEVRKYCNGQNQLKRILVHPNALNSSWTNLKDFFYFEASRQNSCRFFY